MNKLNGKKLGKYEIVELIAQGGMAEVYKAHQSGVERVVVAKVLHCHLSQSTALVERFRREARAIGSLQHPNIVRIIDFDTEGDIHYMVMDYIEGGTLSERLKSHQFTVDETLYLGVQLTSALAYAHQRGVIHRDIKPGNILFSDDSGQHVVLTDFGLAHLCDDNMLQITVSGAMIGTPTYMSPEAVRGEPCDARSDLYSLGVVLYELLTGKPPYVANTPYSMMMKQANEPLPLPRSLNPDLPVAVEEVLLRMLAKEPAERYPDAAAVTQELRNLLDCLQNKPASVASTLDAEQGKIGSGAENITAVIAAKSQPLPRVEKSGTWKSLALALGSVVLVTIAMVQLLLSIG